MKLGTNKYEAGKKTFKLEGDKSLATGVFRILPAMGSLADAGRYFMRYEVEWGYKDSDGINRPFLNPRKLDFNNPTVDPETGKNVYTVLVESAAHLRRQALRTKKDDVIRAFRAGNATQDQVKEISDEAQRYNLDIKYYYNVVNLNNEIGLLKLNNSFHKALKAAIKKFREENGGKDPLGMEGIYFSFRRTNDTGKLQDYVFEVTPYQENIKVNDMTYQQVKTHTIDDGLISRLDTEAFDLGDMYPSVSAEEVQQLVDEGANAVDRILGKAKSGKVSSTTQSQTTLTKKENTSTNLQNEAPQATLQQEQPQATLQQEQPQATLQQEQPQATLQQEQPQATLQNEAPQATSTDAMSEEDFLKSIGAL